MMALNLLIMPAVLATVALFAMEAQLEMITESTSKMQESN